MKRVHIDRELALAIVGLALLSIGAGLVLVPAAALVVLGLGLLAYAIFLSPDSPGGPTT